MLRRQSYGGDFDFRLAVSGVQASFRRAANGEGGAADNNCVLAGSGTEIQSLTDMIPQSAKTTPHARYVLTAASATRRPLVSANGAIGGTGAAFMDGGPALASLYSNGVDPNSFPMTFYTAWSRNGGASMTPAGLYSGAGTTLTTADVYTNLQRGTRNLSGTAHTVLTGTAPAGAGIAALVTYADHIERWQDGAQVGSDVAVTGFTTFTEVAIMAYRYGGVVAGFLPTGAYLLESFWCNGAHADATIVEVSDRLQTYWEGRGVVF